jgi:DNA polymerase-3 subunit epsilon
MYFPDIQADRRNAAQWAADLLARADFVILDTETTGFSHTSEVIQISIIDPQGQPLLDTLVKPLGEIGAEAAAVNGLTIEKCAGAPTWAEIYPKFCEVVTGKTVVIFNRNFDLRIIKQTVRAYDLDEYDFWGHENTSFECAMQWYSDWVGDWNYRQKRYTWQRLPGGDHTALGDCLATLEVIKKMAASVMAGMEVGN